MKKRKGEIEFLWNSVTFLLFLITIITDNWWIRVPAIIQLIRMQIFKIKIRFSKVKDDLINS